MKTSILLLIIGFAVPLQAARYQDDYYNQRVSGYERSNGTYVEPYYRHHDYNQIQNYQVAQPVYQPQPAYQFQPMQMPSFQQAPGNFQQTPQFLQQGNGDLNQ